MSAELNKEFVVNLKGKDFVTFNGLMDLAHQMDLQSIETELIQIPNKENGSQCIMKAVAKTKDGKVFEGYGDADPSNVNSKIARHLIRMAETRPKARALRDLTNVGMTAFEELAEKMMLQLQIKEVAIKGAAIYQKAKLKGRLQ